MWHRIRGVSDLSHCCEDGNAVFGTDMILPIRKPNQPPANSEDQHDVGFATMAVRQPKPPPMAVKDQYEQGFMKYPERQPFGPPDLKGFTIYGTLNSEWAGFSPYSPIRQPIQPPENEEDMLADNFAKNPTRQPITAPNLKEDVDIDIVGFKERPQYCPVRQPNQAPTKGKIQIVPNNFKRWAKEVASPPHQRVTAGGRIVPVKKDIPYPPQYDALKVVENMNGAKPAWIQLSGPPLDMSCVRTASSTTL
jgi:hypothetical protein